MRRDIASLGLTALVVLASAAGKQPITGADVLKIRNVTSGDKVFIPALDRVGAKVSVTLE